jgi:plastocyanin
LGYSPVNDGYSENVAIEIDLAGATETLYAMLHTDGGEIGAWEFPGGPDGPVQVEGQVVTPPFAISGLPAALAAMPVPSEGEGEVTEMVVTPSVTVSDQEILDGAVTIAEVISSGPGWLVIHAQAEGKPGPVLGLSPVTDGANADVTVEIDLSGATGTLYAMLHTDAGEVGAWEFPGGPDVPVTVEEQVVTPAFRLLAASGEVEVAMTGYSFQPGTLVVTAGTKITWVNNDGQVKHDVASDTGLFESELFNGDDSFSYTFDQPGVYPYYCHPHGGPEGDGMAGTIVVLAAG